MSRNQNSTPLARWASLRETKNMLINALQSMLQEESQGGNSGLESHLLYADSLLEDLLKEIHTRITNHQPQPQPHLQALTPAGPHELGSLNPQYLMPTPLSHTGTQSLLEEVSPDIDHTHEGPQYVWERPDPSTSYVQVGESRDVRSKKRSLPHEDAPSNRPVPGEASDRAKRTQTQHSNTSSSTRNASQASAPKNKASKPSRSAIAPTRRPTKTDAWYSDSTSTEESWAKLSISRRRDLSHVGYIDETDAGMPAPEPCMSCKNMSRYNHATGKREKLTCMVYKPETVSRYTQAQGDNWRCCSNCWTKSRQCDFVKDEADKIRLRTASEEEVERFERYTGKRVVREPDGSVSFA